MYSLLLVIILIVLYYKRPIKILQEAYKTSEEETRWQPAHFTIYDNSTPEICDRFIEISPFNWYVWAIQNQVYILENTSGIICQIGTTPAIKVTPDPKTFTHVCLTVTIDGILSQYTKAPYTIFYDITDSSVENKFTVLDALNILFREYITIKFVDETTNVIDTFYGLHEKPKVSMPINQFTFSKYTSLKQSQLDELQKRLYEYYHQQGKYNQTN